MNTYIILLKGVNVGGKQLLPMKELKALLGRGFENVKTYIQSGNIVLMATKNPKSDIRALIQSEYGFAPEVLALSEIEFISTISNNPYQEYEGNLVHFFFCKDSSKVDSTKLEELKAETESYELIGGVFYLHAPNGIGRSKLVANIETCFGGAPVTGRNLNTVNKLRDMVENT